MKTQLLLYLFLTLIAGNCYAQPSNDECSNPILLTPSSTNSCSYTTGTTSGATQSMTTYSCNGAQGNADDDVWFAFYSNATSEVITVIGCSGFDAVVEIRGNCVNPSVPISCADATADGGTETITLNNLGWNTYRLIRVYNYGTGSGSGSFQICVSQFTPTVTACSLSGITPTLSSPGSNSSPGQTVSTTSPTLSWNNVSNASNYEVYISKYPYGSANIIFQDLCVSGTSLTIPSGYLVSGTQYRWNIIGVSSCGSCCYTNAASPLYFNVGGGCAIASVTPTINSPGSSSSPGQNIGITTTPTLSWNAVSGATDYGVYIRDMYTNSLILNDDCASSGTSYIVPSGILYNGGQFRWNVQANVSCGSCASNFASPLYFTISTTVGGLNDFTEREFNIYPNPNSGTFTLKLDAVNIPVQIKVINAIGETIYSEATKNLSKKEINLSHVPTGVYSVHVIAGEKNYHEKIVIE